MRILLVQPNVKMRETGVQLNHGLAILSSVLKEDGHEVALSVVDDFSYKKRTYLENLENKTPDLIAFAAYSNQWIFLKEIASTMRRFTSVPVLCGGPHATLFPDALIESAAIDAFVVGEGEIVIRQIAKGIQSGTDWFNIPGVWSKKKDGSVLRNGTAPRVKNLDALSFPDYGIYSREVVLNYPGITFSRGCPYDCSYCCNRAYRQLYSATNDGLRFMSPERAIMLAKYYKDTFKPDHLEIDDDTFTKNPRWLKEFLGGFKKEVALPFNCNARPETITSERVEWLREGGCQIVSLGIESGHEPLREKVLKRRMTNQDIISAAELIHGKGLKLSTFNMIGLPGENWKKFRETIRLNQKLAPDNLQITVYYPFRGTELGDFCYTNNLVNLKDVAGSYFGETVLRIPGFPKWQVTAGHLFFKFLVYYKNSLSRAIWALAKDCVKSFPFSNLLIRPYLRIKRSFLRQKSLLQ